MSSMTRWHLGEWASELRTLMAKSPITWSSGLFVQDALVTECNPQDLLRSYQHYLQWEKHGNNPSVHWWMKR